MYWGKVRTCWGTFHAAWEEGKLYVLLFPDQPPPQGKRGRSPLLFELGRQLDAYFRGELRSFDVPLRLRGTRFQLAVWEALQEIPYGQAVTYGELAELVGRPRAARAVGRAVGANPLPILVPCHRVVAVGGLGGYGSGLSWKERLLALEGWKRGE